MGTRGSHKEFQTRRRLTMEAIYEKQISGSRVNVSNLLRFSGVSRSSYYRYVKRRLELPIKDMKTAKLIERLHHKRKGKIGIRQLKMELYREHGLIVNHKKIARIKRQLNLVTLIRKKRTYTQLNAQKHKVFSNILDRKFKAKRPLQKLLTDITQINYGIDKKAYLVAFKDLGDKSIVSYKLSRNMKYDFVNKALDKLCNTHKLNGALIHSDQGSHFTCKSFVKRLEKEGVIQSMSRRGECHDNAPMESFFGLIKDHLEPKEAYNFDEIKKQVDKAIYYYNYERPQIGLNKMPPVEYRRQII